jgi:SAM-dependent methyltransferase
MATTEWFANERFWEASYRFLFSAQRFTAGESESEAVVRLAGVDRGQVLDLGCGPGRHAIPLTKAGYRVTGVDRSRYLLGKAVEEADRRNVSVEWVEADMRSFVREDAFDLVLCMFTSFGYFADDSENRKVLDNVYRSLRSGGRFVLDVMGKELLATIFQPSGTEHLPGLGTLFSERTWGANFSTVENRWTLVSEDGSVERLFFRHWVYSAHELELMLCDAGFRTVQVFGDLSGGPYGPGASRLITVAHGRS